MVDLYYTGTAEDDNPHTGNEENHDGCEKKVADLKELLEELQEKYKIELKSLRSECEKRLSESICKICKKNNLMTGEEGRNCQPSMTLELFYKEKLKKIGSKYNASTLNKDLELKVYQIKEEVRKDYEIEIDKIREEIIAKELKRKDEEINVIRTQLNDVHKIEIEKLWQRYEELANKEVENSVIRVKNEVILSQELEEKAKIIDHLKNEKKEFMKKQKSLIEQKHKEVEQLAINLKKAHEKEIENIRQAFEIEMTTKVETILEEKVEMEEKFRKQIEKLQEDINRVLSEKDDWQESQDQIFQQLTEKVRRDTLHILESQIKASVASADEGGETSQWPPELVALEKQFATKYQRQLAQLVEEHALEIADIKAEYDAKLSALVKECSIKQVEEMPLGVLSTGDVELDKIVRERDNLRSLALTLRQVVCELARYLTTCEDELNKSIVGELLKLAVPYNGHQMQVNVVGSESSDSEGERSLMTHKRVHFAPDVSSLVTLMDDDYLLDCLESSMDVSVHLHSELQSCLERLRGEAATVLGLTQMREKALPSTVEDRRLTSLTRQLIEEKKAKDEANMFVQSLQEQLQKYEKELHDMQKEMAETKERIIKEQIAEEAEFEKQHVESRTQNLHRLQEKAQALLSEKGDCPPVWLGLIEELCMEGDALIEDAWRARDELQSEVEAADKQLRSTRAFLEEQASEREQERDESGKEIARLTDLLRERERDWTSHKQFASEVAAVEQRLNETTDLLKETEVKKEKVEKELKAAVDKIWVLRDIISELEVQVSTRCEREQALEHRVAELEAELDTQNHNQEEVLQELQTLKDRRDQDLQLELSSVQDQMSNNSSPRVVRQIKSQLKVMARAMEKQIKELETVNIHVSSASLSSPSEDISIREQLEALRCGTPEDRSSCNSSPSSPLFVEEVNQLNDKLLRYSRAGENVIKKLRDRDMEIIILRTQNDELQTERDVLQGQSERQLMQLASLHKKVEELRVRSERDIQVNAAPLHERILSLEKQISSLTDELHDSQRKVVKMKQKLDRSEAIVQSQEAELSSLSEHQQDLVYKLQQDLASMKVEKQQLQDMVEKYRTQDNISFPRLIEVMLAEKNADIDQLQERVEELQNQQEHFVSKSQSQQSKIRSYRVSFADDIAQSRLVEGDKARDLQHHHDGSRIRALSPSRLISIEENGDSLVPRAIGEDISNISEPANFNLNSSPNRAIELENVLSQLKTELEQKTQRLIECEAQLQELPALEQELTKAKEELMETVRVVSEDKRFYEEQLKTLNQTKELLAKREEELAGIRAELDHKEEDIVRTTADLKALHIIMDGLQQKLKEAKTFAEDHEVISVNNQVQELRLTSEKYKEECDTQKTTIVDLENKILQLNDTLKGYQEDQNNLNETISKLEKDKKNIVSELVMTKSKCKSLQEELEKAILNATENSVKIQSLHSDLETSQKENKKLSVSCQRLKKDMELLTKKQKTELKNILKKDTEEALKVKEELENLKLTNSELQSECEKLRQELHELGSNLELLKEMSNKDDKIQQLEADLKELDKDNKTLRGEKNKIEQSLNMEISELKVLIDDLNTNIVALETESKESQDIIQERQQKENLIRRFESLKREYERQRRARRENEKKCFVLKSELEKEKQFTARLQNGAVEKRVPQLTVTKATIVDIASEGVKLANSLDNLAHEVQKELNTSAQLDQSLISGLQQNAESAEVPRSSSMPPRVDYLTERLAEVETALHVEKVVVSELRARLTEERARYLEERSRTHDLCQELASLQTLNDQFEDKFKNIAHQLEHQVNEVKELKRNGSLADENVKEVQRLKKLLEESEKRVDKLLEERVFNKNQLLYLREELAKVLSEREIQMTGHGDECKGTAMEELQQALECRTRELQEQQQRCMMLQRMLDLVNKGQSQQPVEAKELQSQVEDLKRQLTEESELRRSLEARIKSVELAERTRNSRRRAAELKLKELVAQGERTKKELERECLTLQRKLKQSHLQLTAHTAESPLSLRLVEANMAVERLVGEKEDLNSANLLLKNEKETLQVRLKEQDTFIDELKTRIHMLNIKVTDGGMDNLNSMFAAERAAWLKEKENLKLALAQAQVGNTDSFNSYSNSAHILQRYLRAESHRNALVWQKRYLMISLRGYQEEEKHTVAALWRFPAPPTPQGPSLESKFRITIYAVRAVFRLQFLVEHRKRSHENTCRILQHALNNAKFVPRRAGNIPDLHSLWKKTEVTSSSNTVHPGSISQYLDDINTIQDRIKNTLSTAS